MSGIRKVWFHCVRDGKRFASYDFGIPIPLAVSKAAPPTNQKLEDEAKTNLTNQRLAFPPYTGVTFEIEYVLTQG
jgi:hypothetical protein